MSEIRKWDFGASVAASQTSKKRPKQKAELDDELINHYPRRRAITNRIPGSEELSRLIDQALNALSRGVYWDRGSIVDIVL